MTDCLRIVEFEEELTLPTSKLKGPRGDGEPSVVRVAVAPYRCAVASSEAMPQVTAGSDHPQRSGTPIAAADTFGVGVMRAVAAGLEVAVARRPAAVDAEGRMPAGVLGIAVDHALGGAIGLTLADDEVMITSHMHLDLVRPMTADIDEVIAHGELVEKGGGHAFARGSIRTPDGRLLALMSARFAMLSLTAVAGGYVRAESENVLPRSAGEVDGTEPPAGGASPVIDLLQLRVADSRPGRLTALLRAHEGLANERLGMHGGVGVLVGERTIDQLVRRLDGPAAFRPVELRAVFLRPIATDGADLLCEAEIGYAGRSVVTSRATLHTTAGKPAVVLDAIHAVDRT